MSCGIFDIDVGDLVVADGEGPAGERVENFAERTGTNAEQPGPLRRMRFGSTTRSTSQWPYSLTTQTRAPRGSGLVEQGSAGVVQFLDQTRQVGAGGTETLGVVVEVGQVDQREVGPFVAKDRSRRSGDPGGAGQAGTGPQKV